MQECLAPLSLRLMAFASSENDPETSTRLDPWHPAEKVWASGYSADGFRLCNLRSGFDPESRQVLPIFDEGPIAGNILDTAIQASTKMVTDED